MASYEGFYGGSGSVLDSDYWVSTGYKMAAGQIGFPGSPQTADQLHEAINAVKHGTKVFEVQMLQPDVAETIPTQHFKEMRALMKLTGVKPSVHGPVIDAAGFGEQGWGKEEMRADNERRMFTVIENAQRIDPSGNLPIVFHSANGAPGVQYRPWNKETDEEEEKDDFGRVKEVGAVVNVKTGQTQQVKREKKWRTYSFNGKAEKQLFDVDTSVGSMNRGEWEGKLTEIGQMNKHADEIMGGARMVIGEYEGSVMTPDGKFIRETPEGRQELPAIERNTGEGEALNKLRRAGLFLENAELSFEGAFDTAYEFGTEKQKKELEKLARKYNEDRESAREEIPIDKNTMGVNVWSPIKRHEALDKAVQELGKITAPRRVLKNGKMYLEEGYNVPKVWKSAEELALDEASKTFGNLAIESYEKFGKKAPVLALENSYPTQALSDAGSLKKLVEESRSKFVKHLRDKGMGEKEAEKLAEDKVGVTWDVGHLNMIKSKGFGKEELLRQTKLISKDKSMVKHVHLTDNFGYADTHLVPGMGNVPFKEHLEILEKTGRLDEMRKITEVGGFVQHFKKGPHSMMLASMGSPIYGMKSAGSWAGAIDAQGSYFGGYGTVNPGTHHQYFGAGFTTMPVELGGQAAGGAGQSRFGGTPLA